MNLSFNSASFSALKPTRSKTGIGSLIVLVLIGAVFIGAGTIALSGSKVDASWSRVDGTIVRASSSQSDSSTQYTAIVEYKVAGQTYEKSDGYSSSSYPNIGSTVPVAYNPAHPDQSKVIDSAGSLWFVWLFPVVGALLIVLGIVSFIRSLRRSAAIKSLVSSGQKLQGVLTSLQSYGRSSYKIVVTAADPNGAVQNYVSDSITGATGLALMDFSQTPVPIDVYVDPLNQGNYYVDISDIPNLTADSIKNLIARAVSGNQPTSGPTPPNPGSFTN